jgi:hypothetical protein
MLWAGTTNIRPDEPAYSLSELNIQSPYGEMRRYRVICVVRGDKLAQHFEDLGSDGKKIEILHSVAELTDIAEHMVDIPTLPESYEPRDIIHEYIDNRDQYHQISKEQGL